MRRREVKLKTVMYLGSEYNDDFMKEGSGWVRARVGVVVVSYWYTVVDHK